MKRMMARTLLLCILASLAVCSASSQQGNSRRSANAPAANPTLLTRTTTRHESRKLGYGGTLTILGAPAGSITIEAWQRSEVDITADIELKAETEEDLTRLAAINNFVVDEDVNHLSILTTGTHDRKFMKRVARNFPKNLMNLPWKIDYRIRVPAMVDLDISAGRGAFTLSGVEGAIGFNSPESNVDMALTGGQVRLVVGQGSVHLNIAQRNWRGADSSFQLASGDMMVELPQGYSGEIDADVLRNGQIENQYTSLTPRERETFTPRSLHARAGAGGPKLTFTVGDGTLKIKSRDG
ncbi:MAG TPA: hypothetical protein VK619_16055 [Pyrinomonadaceae bacterium]|nr:hypothetical protein [Pyrinomonadaceae bacterium]